MKSLRKVLSCVLALTIVAGMFAMPAAADETEEQAVVIEAADEAAAPDAPVYDTAGTPDENGFIVENGVLTGYEGTGGDVVIPSGVTSINLGVFKGNTKVRTVTMPDTVTKMNSSQYYGLEGVTNAEKGTFKDCTNLTSVKLSQNLTCIGAGAFAGCTSLKSIDIPDSVTEIGRSAFNGAGVENVTFGKNITTLYALAFANSKIKTAVLPNKLTSIGGEAFAGCTELTSVSIPDSITDDSFGVISSKESTFTGCTSLKTIKFSSNMTKIPVSCFKGCTALTDLVIPSNILHLESQCFSHCDSLVNVDLGNIQSYCAAFPYCPSIKELILPNTLTTITKSSSFANWGPFDGMTGVEVFQIPATITDTSKQQMSLDSAFPALKTLYINKNTECFGENDFKSCPLLADIYYSGTKSEWESKVLYKNPDVYLVTNKEYYTIHCSDGIIVGSKVKKVSEITASLKYGYTVNVGDELDLTKIEILVKYSDNSSNSITAATDSVTVKGYDKTKSGKQTLTITYEGKSTTLTIDVKGSSVVRTVSTITAGLEEGYLIYKGDELDKSKVIVTVFYTDGSYEEIRGNASGVTISGYSKTKGGSQNLTVKYSGKTTTLVITVLDKGAPVLNDDITLDGEAVASYEAAIKSIGNKAGEFTLTINAPITVSKFTFPKNAKLEIIATENGSITTTAASLAPSAPLVIECPITNSKGKAVAINAKSDLTVTGGSFGNITVKGKAELTNVIVNGSVKLAAKADKFGLTTDTLTNVTATKGVSSNNNVEFADCPSLGTINVKGTVKITGAATRAVALTASSKTGISEVENLTVEKKVSIAGNLIASGLTSAGAVDVKGTATIADSTIAGKLSTKGALNVNGEVYCANAISCAQLTSNETAHLTYQSLAVTKDGIAANSADITVKVIDKKGSTVRFVAGDKKAVVVKSLKLPKGGTYNAVLILDEDCGTGTLTFEKNKVVLK